MRKIIAIVAAALMVCGTAAFSACAEEHEHVWNDGEVTTEATCTTAGVKTYSCTVEGCTETRTEPVDKVAHVFTGDWVKVDDDNHARKCVNCTVVDTTAAAHNFVEDIERREPATCHSDGVKHLVCEECNAETTEAITERPAHDFAGDWVKVDGDNHARKCVNCTAVDTTAAAHNFVEDIERREPATCHSDGVKHLECEECNAETTEAITERPAHDFTGDWVKVDGDNHAKKCKDCEAVSEETVAHTYPDNYLYDADGHWQVCEDCKYATDPVEHDWDEGEITTQPAFLRKGEKTYSCRHCAATTTEEVAALTTSSHADEFTVNAEGNPWGYGRMDVTDWGEDFKYNLLPATQTTNDAYVCENVEIKGGWLSGGGSYISYTVNEDVTIRLDIISTQVSGGKRMDVRTVVGNEARYHGNYNDSVMTFSENYTLSAGDIVYIVFSPKGEDAGFDQTDFTINISKV